MGEKGRGIKRVSLILFYLLVTVVLLSPVVYGTLHGYSVPSSDGAQEFDVLFSIFSDDVLIAESRLPYVFYPKGYSSLSLFATLPEDIQNRYYLLFYTKQTGLRVYVEGKERYSWYEGDDFDGYPEKRIPHVVPLYPEDSGRSLEVVYPFTSFFTPGIEIGKIMTGSASSLFHYTFDHYKISIILIPFFLMLGVFMLIMAFFSRGNTYAGTIFSFGILVLLVSMGLFSNSILFVLVSNKPGLMSLICYSCFLLEPLVVFMVLHNISRSGSVFRLYGGFHLAAVAFCTYYVVIGFLKLIGIFSYGLFEGFVVFLVPMYELCLVYVASRHRLLGDGRLRYSYYIAIMLLAVKNIIGLLSLGSVTYDVYVDLFLEVCSMISMVLFILEGVLTYFGGHDMIVNVSGYIKRSHYDRLSGLMNRRGFHHWRDNVLKEEDLPYYTVVFDINGMKEINDNYGHLVGDGAIRLLGGVIESLTTGEDAAFRMGGDEFAVFLKGGNKARVISFIAMVGDMLVESGLSVSSAYLPLSDVSATGAVLAGCDRMLYLNKRMGGGGCDG